MSSSDEENDNKTYHEEEENDVERTVIRSELSSLSFEELQKLKEKLGAKVYNEALFGTKLKKVQDERPKIFKRENKNRPREMSSKKPVSMLRDAPKIKKKEVRDPRFDPLCGSFDKNEFSQNYNFLKKIQSKDIQAIRAELKETNDPEQQLKLRRLLQRVTDKLRANKRSQIEKESLMKEQEVIKQDLADGKGYHFKNKTERRVEALVSQYEQLKSEGTARVQRHLKRRQQKVKKRSHKAPTGVS